MSWRAISALIATAILLPFIILTLMVAGGLAAEQRCGTASWYGNEHHGRRTASGAIFNQWAMTAAMPSRKYLGHRYLVAYRDKSVVVTITDTGGFAKYGRIIDLSRGAFAKLASTDAGVLKGVCLTRLS